MESLYKGRMKAIRFGEVDIGSQKQITADETDARMQCTRWVALTASKSISRDAYCSGLVIRAEQSLVYEPRKKGKKRIRINPFSLARQRAQPHPPLRRFQPVEFVARSRCALLRARRASCGQPLRVWNPAKVLSSQLLILVNCLPRLPAGESDGLGTKVEQGDRPPPAVRPACWREAPSSFQGSPPPL